MTVEVNRLLFVVNTPEFFISHRLPLALAAREEGFEVHVATANGAGVQRIKAQGINHHVIDFARSGQDPLVELKTLYQILNLFKLLKPNLIHLVTIKPVLYGGICARFCGIEGVVSAISGLGIVFSTHSPMSRLRKWFISHLYTFAFRQKSLAVIFQNLDDRDTLLSTGALKLPQARMIRGSGIWLSEFPIRSEPEGKPVVAMAARLLRTKGVVEFVEAARILKKRSVSVDMRLIGSPDLGNPTSISENELMEWNNEGIVSLLGHRSDIAEQYAASNIVCLPSYYGEGLPKCLVEAAAAARAVVTTDHPGCRDAIIPDQTGLLVPIKDPVALADAIQKLIEDPKLRERMGKAGRALAEKEFSIDKIVSQHLQIYEEVLGGD